MAERIVELGEGLELWKVAPSEVREQNLNARVMPPEMFNRLAKTVGRDKRLESLPLCAQTENGIEVISGHHRLRSAIAAQLPYIYIVVDVTGLTRDQIAAKQLAHNAISGTDDNSLLRQIFTSIQDAEAKLEAFVDIPTEKLPTIKTHDIDLDLDYKSVLMLFLPSDKAQFDKILEDLPTKLATVYVADRERFDQFKKIVDRVNQEYDIRSAGTVLSKMCEIVNEFFGAEPNYTEAVAIRDVFKVAFIPKDTADRLTKALEHLKKTKQIEGAELWKALDRWAAEELGENAQVAEATK